MELATGLLRCAVMVFMFISLVLSICLFHLVSSPVSGSLKMLFLYSKMITLDSNWITVPFLCWQVFPKSVKRLFSFTWTIFDGDCFSLWTPVWFQTWWFSNQPTDFLCIIERYVLFSLDINKAFDKVWHAALLCKLEALGVQPPLLQWFESYLLNRKQRVVIDE